MPPPLRLSLAQINSTVGDIGGNRDRILAARRAAGDVDLVVFHELFLSGYPPDDLVLRGGFLEAMDHAIGALAEATADGGPGVLIGAPVLRNGKRHNAALVLADGAVQGEIYKHCLPNYGVFDEIRVFHRGPLPGPIQFRDRRLGVMICEDMWFPEPAAHLQAEGADCLIVPNGSPFSLGKAETRHAHAADRVRQTGLPLVYLNQLGGQDELVFDGASFALNGDGALAARLPAFRSDRRELVLTGTGFSPSDLAMPPGDLEAIYRAMVLGLADYVGKNRFPGVIVGLSGGIDSALSAAVAVDALGADRVRCVMMPSPYTSAHSLEDAAACAERLGVHYDSIDIGPAMAAFDGMLEAQFAGRTADVTEENIQSRIRGLTLMALSNKFGHMVLTTGNKSEMSVGYATLYGDMCGGFSVLKDVYKMDVFRVADWRNRNCPDDFHGPPEAPIPQRILDRPPSAELRPDQKDEDSLPPYPVLDEILRGLIEDQLGVSDIVARGHDRLVVEKVWNLLNIAEYKRRQAPPGVKITALSFGRERRYPITNGYRFHRDAAPETMAPTDPEPAGNDKVD